jgi:hypothetical protein
MDATICLLLLLPPRSIEINNNPHDYSILFSHWSSLLSCCICFCMPIGYAFGDVDVVQVFLARR